MTVCCLHLCDCNVKNPQSALQIAPLSVVFARFILQQLLLVPQSQKLARRTEIFNEVITAMDGYFKDLDICSYATGSMIDESRVYGDAHMPNCFQTSHPFPGIISPGLCRNKRECSEAVNLSAHPHFSTAYSVRLHSLT